MTPLEGSPSAAETSGSVPSPLGGDLGARVTGVAALAEPLRRDLYRFVVAQPQAVSREQAAAGVGVPLHLAKFHLDKLVADGLLEFEFRRPPGRRGPGAGRPAKVYRRSPAEFFVSLPERRYEFVGLLLARAVTESEREGVPLEEAVRQAAREAGRTLGGNLLQRARPRPRRSDLRDGVVAVLRDSGYEPRWEDGRLLLTNCPFHALARDYTQLACGLNLDLMTGFVTSVPGARLEAGLEPAEGRCCVVLHKKQDRVSGRRERDAVDPKH